MRLLIDGNNLLHATDLFAADTAPHITSQQLLVELLVRLLGKRAQGDIVFDGRPRDPGPASLESLHIHYASRREEADDVIERLLAATGEPKRLTVISSDHRLQRAARQRGAAWRDSEDFWRELVALRSAAARPGPTPEKPESSADEVERWLREFGADER